MDKQEIFNKVWNGAKAQGFERSIGEDGTCLYRGPKGLKCNAGLLIPDEEYREYMEGCNVMSLSSKTLFALGRMWFVDSLQKAHDRAVDSKTHEDNLRRVAQNEGLTEPE